MQFGLYAPVPHVTVGSAEVSASVAGALTPLSPGAVDPGYQFAKDLVIEADRSGFDIVLFAERHLGADMEAWVLGSAVSSWTNRIRSMVAVHPGLWHPAMIAKMAASLDRLAPGRMAINLVTGWNEPEYKMFGGDLLLGQEDRYLRAEEFIAVLRGLWATSPFSFDGRIFKVESADLQLRPATARPPDIFTASRNPRGQDMVAAHADWWFLDYDKSAPDTAAVVDSLRQSIAGMRERAQRFDRTVRFAFNPFVAFGAGKDEAEAAAKKLLVPDGPGFDERKVLSRVGPAMKCGCIGKPADVRDQLRRFRDIGIDLFLFKMAPSIAGLRAVRDELIEPLRAEA